MYSLKAVEVKWALFSLKKKVRSGRMAKNTIKEKKRRGNAKNNSSVRGLSAPPRRHKKQSMVWKK